MKTVLTSIAFLLICISGFSQTVSMADRQKFDELFNTVSSDPKMLFNGIVIVMENGKLVYKNTKGYADISKQKNISTNTNFSLASLSKIFTAIAVMQLKQQGKVDLNDALITYLPEFPFPEITIKQLLSHTSGLPDFEIFQKYAMPETHILSNNEVIPALKNVQLIATPGSEWHYSSIGYCLLALLTEKITGLSFQEYLEVTICKPAGMKNTYVAGYDASSNDTTTAVNYVHPIHPGDHLAEEDALKENKQDPVQTLIGPGLIVSNVDDLLKLDAALYSDVLLNTASKEEMFTPVKLTDGSYAQLNAPIYNGLGWGIDIDTSAGKIVSHNGGSPGIATILLRNIKKKQTVIVLENTDNFAPIFFGVNAMNLLNNRPPARFRMD